MNPPNVSSRSLLPSVLVLALSACATVGPDYSPPKLATPTLWSNGKDSQQTGDLSQWWQKLDDPMLTALVAESLKNSPDLLSAQARLREARARRDLASANRFPTLNGGLSGDRTRASEAMGAGGARDAYQAGFDASWEPDVFGGKSRALQAADADAEASRDDLHGTQVSLAAETALNYIELRSAQERLGITRENLATQEEILQITDWRQQAGLATVTDVEQARAAVEQTRALLPNLETNLVQARNRLAVLTGQTPGALDQRLAPVHPLPKISGSVATGIPADTLRQRPDVRASERRLAAETARIGERTAELYPAFSLSGNFGWRALSLGALGNAGTVTSALLASMTQTLFDAGRVRDTIRIQTAIQERALATYQKTVLIALEDVENALAAYANSRDRQASLRNAVQSSRIAAELARQLYESGLVDFQKVLDTQRTRLTTEESLAVAEAEGISYLVSLYKALGGGWQETDNPQENPS